MKTVLKSSVVVLLVVFAGVAFVTWYKATHFSLKNFLQKILDDNHIPVTIHKIEIKGKTRDIINDLLEGGIDHMVADVEHKLLKQRIKLSTPIHYKLEKNSINIHATPTLENRVIGVVDLSLDTVITFERKATWIELKTIHLGVEFQGRKPVSYQSIHVGAFSGKASFVTDPQTTLKEHVFFQSSLILDDLIFETARKSYNQKKISFALQGLTNGTDFSNLVFKFRKPVPFLIQGGFENNSLNLNFDTTHSLQESINVLGELLQSSFLDKIEARDGVMSLKGTLQTNPLKIVLHARIKADELLINNLVGNMNLKTSKLMLENHLNYPLKKQPQWGRIEIEAAKLGAFKTKPFKINFAIHPHGMNYKLDGLLSVPAFGSGLALSNLEIFIPFDPTKEFRHEYALPGVSFPATIRTSLSAGPFELEVLQKKFCVLHGKPLKGSVSLHYKDVYNRFGVFEIKGEGKGSLLGGGFEIGNLFYSFDRSTPKLGVNLSLRDLDLQEIGAFTNFGDMRGSLDVSLMDASYFLSTEGLIPHEYDLTIKGRERSGKIISFYGRAIDNILEMVGSRKADMSWIDRSGINIGMAFRNWFPATAEYMGVRAKTSSGWTELHTFDPELRSNDSKKRYLLYGTGLKIPLNSHGVYPAIMKSEDFQQWLWHMIRDFSKKGAQSKEKCYPFWEYDYEVH